MSSAPVTSFDVGTIPQLTVQEIMYGLMTSEVALADSICTTYTRGSTLNGKVPVMTSASTLARAENIGLPPLAENVALGGAMTTADYNCLARVGDALVSDEEVNDMGALGADAASFALTSCRRQANFKTDYVLAQTLESTTLNEEFDCNVDGNGEWNDYTNGTPLADLLLAADEFAPDADTFVIGRRVHDILLAHPDIKAQIVMINNGQLDYNGLFAYLRTKIPNLQNFHVLDKLYNTAARGQTVAPGRLFSEKAWLGHKADLLLVEPNGAAIQNRVTQQRAPNNRALHVQYVRYNAILRPTKSLGVTFTNVIGA